MSKKYISPELNVVLFETKDDLMAGGYEASNADPFAGASSSSSMMAQGQEWIPIDSLK